MNTPNSFVVQHKQSDPTVIDRDLDSVVGQNQFEVIVFHRIAGLLVAANAAEVKQVLRAYCCAHIRRNFGPPPNFDRQIFGLHALFKHALAVFDLFKVLDHCKNSPPLFLEAKLLVYVLK